MRITELQNKRIASANPRNDRSCNPGIFWYWNADPTPAGIRKQLSQIQRAGFLCVYLHPMPEQFHRRNFFRGMTIGYLGEKFFSLAAVMLEECKRLNLTMMLYDEGGWPSGGVLGRLIQKHPECKAVFLSRRTDGKGYLSETADFPDLLNAHTTRCFIEMTHEVYRKHFGGEFGKTIRGIFTDEPFWCCQPGRDKVRISDGMPAAVETYYSSSFEKDILPYLFADAPDCVETEEARRKYLDVCSRLMSKNYSQVLADWCERNHLELEGHFNNEDQFFRTDSNGNIIRMLEPFQVPGVDAIWRQIYPGFSEGGYARFASAAAIRGNRREALCECFNVYGYFLTPKIMNWVANSLLAQGINRILPMPFLYSDRGMRKICCGTDISPRNPIWDAVPDLNAFWHWAGDYDTGALKPEVWLLAGCEHSTPNGCAIPEKNIQSAARMEQIMKQLDDSGVFWRFADAGDWEKGLRPKLLIAPYPIRDRKAREEIQKLKDSGVRILSSVTEEEIRKYSYVKIKQGDGCRILPCLRPEGEVLMIFNPTDATRNFRFQSRDFQTELPPPDSAPSELYPVNVEGENISVPMPPGGLRILRKGIASNSAPAWETSSLKAKWRMIRAEKIHYSQYGRTHYSKAFPASGLSANGNFQIEETDFSGRLVLRTDIESPRNAEACLELEDVCYSAALRVNGVPVGSRAFAPWVFKTLLRKGKNRLELTISSSGGNEWRRCFREELEGAGWFNSYAARFKTYTIDDACCGVGERITLNLKKEK